MKNLTKLKIYRSRHCQFACCRLIANGLHNEAPLWSSYHSPSLTIRCRCSTMVYRKHHKMWGMLLHFYIYITPDLWLMGLQLSCLVVTVPEANCSLADTACQCESKILPVLTVACLLENCTMHDQLGEFFGMSIFSCVVV